MAFERTAGWRDGGRLGMSASEVVGFRAEVGAPLRVSSGRAAIVPRITGTAFTCVRKTHPRSGARA
jgi:hypothetical protein